jgi:hypothetical protein
MYPIYFLHSKVGASSTQLSMTSKRFISALITYWELTWLVICGLNGAVIVVTLKDVGSIPG